MIAFKRPEKITEHIAKSVVGETKYFEEKGDFSVFDEPERARIANNCESLANRCVLGLNFSELVHGVGRSQSSNRFAPSTKSYLDENERRIGGLISYTPSSKITEIKGHKKRGNENRVARDIDREGIEMQNCIEIHPKNYRIDSSATELANLLSKLSI